MFETTSSAPALRRNTSRLTADELRVTFASRRGINGGTTRARNVLKATRERARAQRREDPLKQDLKTTPLNQLSGIKPAESSRLGRHRCRCHARVAPCVRKHAKTGVCEAIK